MQEPPRQTFHGPEAAIAGRSLFRLAEQQRATIRDSYQRKHMLYWLGVVLDDNPDSRRAIGALIIEGRQRGWTVSSGDAQR